LLEIILQKGEELRQLLGYGADALEIQLKHTTNQLIELISDTISAYVCPTAFMSAATIISVPFESPTAPDGALAQLFRYRNHPPLDSRLVAMQNALGLTKVLDKDRDFEKYVESAKTFVNQKNLVGLTSSSYDFIQEYNNFARTFSRKVVDVLPRLGVEGFDEDEFEYVKGVFLKPSDNALSPIQLLTLAWIKRLKAVKNDGLLIMQDYFDKRFGEEKMFEQIINSMHKYYEKEIVTKMEMTWRDIRYYTY